MAEEIALRITTDGSQAEKSVKSIRTELKEAQQNAVNLARQFGELSPQAIEAAQKVANLRDEFGDLQNRIAALNPDAKFKAFSQSLQGVAGGFAAVQGAIGLFGTESEELERQLLKVQSALALSEGLNSVFEAKDAFSNLRVVAVNAFNAIKTAIGSTGIGLLVVALGTVVTYWDDIKEAVTGTNAELDDQNKTVGKNVKLQEDKLKQLNSQDATLKLQGLSEKQILQLKSKQTEELIRQKILQLEIQEAINNQKTDKAAQNFSRLTATLNNLGVTAGLSAKISSIFFNPGEVAQKGKETTNEIKSQLDAARNQLAQYQLDIKQIDERAYAEAKQRRQEALKDETDRRNAELERLKGVQAERAKIVNDGEKALETSLAGIRGNQEIAAIAAELNRTEFERKQADERVRIQREELEAKAQLQEAYLGVLGQFGGLVSQLAGKNKTLAISGVVIEQAAAIGRIISNTAVANAKAVAASPLTGGMPFVAINKISAGLGIASSIASAAKAIQQIKSAPGGSPSGGGGGGLGGGAGVPGGAAVTQAPIASAVQVQQTALTPGGNQVDVMGQGAVKAFVVERDITDTQDRIAKIKAAATI